MHNPTEVPLFGSLVRRYRDAAHLTQEHLAERAGISVQAISQLEPGLRQAPHRETVLLLADALGLTDEDRAAFVAAARRSTERGGAGPAADRRSGSAALPPGQPLVGRQSEVALLQRHLARAQEKEGPPLLMLAGEPGIGKSRLLWEAAQVGAAEGWTVLRGGCQRRSGQEPYAPLLGAIRSCAAAGPRPCASCAGRVCLAGQASARAGRHHDRAVAGVDVVARTGAAADVRRGGTLPGAGGRTCSGPTPTPWISCASWCRETPRSPCASSAHTATRRWRQTTP